jgi:pSer/pThr/pTyr-binding forkhead associated (FHA) protein
MAPECRVCASPIADRVARTEPRPHLGIIRFSTGQDAVVAGPIAIGRNPPSGIEIDGEPAAAVAIDDSEISRYHLAVRVAEWYVSVEDQGSTNGTVVRLPGKADQTLRPFERVQLVVGAVVELGGNVILHYEAR